MNCRCIDFACSWDFWRDHCITVHNYDPGDIEPSHQEEPLLIKNVVHYHRYIPITKKKDRYTII